MTKERDELTYRGANGQDYIVLSTTPRGLKLTVFCLYIKRVLPGCQMTVCLGRASVENILVALRDNAPVDLSTQNHDLAVTKGIVAASARLTLRQRDFSYGLLIPSITITVAGRVKVVRFLEKYLESLDAKALTTVHFGLS